MIALLAPLLLASVASADVVRPLEGARDGADRPVLSGPEHVLASDDGFFEVHYTLEGADAPAGGDADGDGVPDTAERTLEALELARAAYEEAGWRPLIGDDGIAGSDALDVYLKVVDINGYAHGIPVDGETDAGACWIEVDGSLGGPPGLILESVAVHELHHCVQYRYTWATHPWLHEATSTYVQYLTVTDPALDLALIALWATRLDQPELPVDDLRGRYEYAAFVFAKFWEELGGREEGRLIRLWEVLVDEPDWRVGLDVAAREEFGLTLDQLFLLFAEYNAFACARDDGQHYVSDVLACGEGVSVPVTEIEEGEPFEVEHEEASHTVAYFELPAHGHAGSRVRVTCDGPGAGERVLVRVVGVDADGVAGEADPGLAAGDQGAEVELAHGLEPDGSALVVLASTGDEPMSIRCSAVRYSPAGDDVGGCAHGPGAGGLGWLGSIALGVLIAGRRRQG